ARRRAARARREGRSPRRARRSQRLALRSLRVELVEEHRAALPVEVDDVRVRRDRAEQADERAPSRRARIVAADGEVQRREPPARPAAQEGGADDDEVAEQGPRQPGGTREPAAVEPEAVEAEAGEEGGDGDRDRGGDRG